MPEPYPGFWMSLAKAAGSVALVMILLKIFFRATGQPPGIFRPLALLAAYCVAFNFLGTDFLDRLMNAHQVGWMIFFGFLQVILFALILTFDSVALIDHIRMAALGWKSDHPVRDLDLGLLFGILFYGIVFLISWGLGAWAIPYKYTGFSINWGIWLIGLVYVLGTRAFVEECLVRGYLFLALEPVYRGITRILILTLAHVAVQIALYPPEKTLIYLVFFLGALLSGFILALLREKFGNVLVTLAFQTGYYALLLFFLQQ